VLKFFWVTFSSDFHLRLFFDRDFPNFNLLHRDEWSILCEVDFHVVIAYVVYKIFEVVRIIFWGDFLRFTKITRIFFLMFFRSNFMWSWVHQVCCSHCFLDRVLSRFFSLFFVIIFLGYDDSMFFHFLIDFCDQFWLDIFRFWSIWRQALLCAILRFQFSNSWFEFDTHLYLTRLSCWIRKV